MRNRRLSLVLLLSMLWCLMHPVTTDAAHTTFTDVMGRFSFAIPDGWTLAASKPECTRRSRLPSI